MTTSNWHWAERVAAGFDVGPPTAPLARVDGQLRTAEWLLWRALGHRDDAPDSRAQAATACLARLHGAAKSLHHIPEWASWLSEAQ